MTVEIPVPKYTIGDTLYTTGYTQEYVDAPCPDCSGTHVWQVKTGSGIEFEIPCQRCAWHSGMPQWQIRQYTPIVHEYMVTGVKFAYRADPGRYRKVAEVSYECKSNELREADVFADRDACMAVATERAATEAERHKVTAAGQYAGHISSMAIRDAVAFAAEELRRQAEIKYERAVEKITELKDEYIDGINEHRLEKVARHLLNELNEDIPSEWGED